jgi:anthranilate synthase component 2
MHILVLDNYDSFTYNLVHLVRALGHSVDVARNDRIELAALEAYDKILLSPGPGVPSEAGILLDVVRAYAGRKSILGVCLGQQAVGEAFGARLVNLAQVYHGVATDIHVCAPAEQLFDGLPATFTAGRYHSWVVDATSLPETLEVTATDAQGQIMALRHRTLDVRGVQFHPESVLTPQGERIIRNWLDA